MFSPFFASPQHFTVSVPQTGRYSSFITSKVKKPLPLFNSNSWQPGTVPAGFSDQFSSTRLRSLNPRCYLFIGRPKTPSFWSLNPAGTVLVISLHTLRTFSHATFRRKFPFSFAVLLELCKDCVSYLEKSSF